MLQKVTLLHETNKFIIIIRTTDLSWIRDLKIDIDVWTMAKFKKKIYKSVSRKLQVKFQGVKI